MNQPDPRRFAPGMERQLARWRSALEAGMPRRGWKIGINVPEVQSRLGLPHAGIGWLDGRRVLASGASYGTNAQARLHVEAEVAVHLGRSVPPSASPQTARACVEGLSPALELVDYARPAQDLDALVAHSMFHEAVVLGARCPTRDVPGLGAAWPQLRIDAAPAAPPRADLVPSDWGALVAFAARLLACFGESLEAGDLLLSGAYMERASAIAPGQEALAEFGELGSVRVQIAAPDEQLA